MLEMKMDLYEIKKDIEQLCVKLDDLRSYL